MAASDLAARLRQQDDLAQAFREIAAPLAAHARSGAAGRLEALAATIGRFEYPVEAEADAEPREGVMALLRAFDRHGEGLVPYRPERRFAAGEVVVDGARTVWVVDSVDKDGHPASLLGGTAATDSKPALVWVQAATARRFVREGQQAGSAYRDPERALRAFAALWGLSESETRYFKKPEALFWQLTETPGVDFARDGLDDDSELEAVRKWIGSNGAKPAGERPPQPGDLVDSPVCAGLGLVLAVAEDGLDILYVEREREGPVGEPQGTAQILRRSSLPPATPVWRPA